MLHDLEPLGGWHDLEQDDVGPFRWTEGSFRVRLQGAARYLRLHLCYYGEQGTLEVATERGPLDRIKLCRGWHRGVLEIDGAAPGELLSFRVTPVVNVASDTRELGIMLRQVEPFDDKRSAARASAAAHNLRRNQDEHRAGLAVLESTPPAIRVNLEARCNIPETSQACAYCAWDWAKLSERGSPAFTFDTLSELGAFYDNAVEVNDCSIGEPAMNKDFGRIIAQIDRDGKQVSLTTNGQLLTPRIRRELLGKNVLLYVSIDSATAEGYARYRNDRFDDIIRNVTALCQEKKAHGGLPRVYVSFIAMRSNVDELPEFFALMKKMGVDEVKLRSLYLDDNVAPATVNGDYYFDYAAEVLHVDEMAAVAHEARRLAKRHDVTLYVESEQFPADVCGNDAPLCSEPWRTLYVLRRGIMPCCYATEPIATWDQRQGRPLDEFLSDVVNNPAMQEIRSHLGEGRLADYCRNTPSCPILKNMQQARLVAGPRNVYQQQALGIPDVVEPPTTLPMVPVQALSHLKRAA